MAYARGKLEPIADIGARVAADQARIRDEKLRWLAIERDKYRLPRLGRLIDDMPA